jgi:ubiquinone/menaquinone biosynthesis C-methylase UbiE
MEYYEIEDFWNGEPSEIDLERIKKVTELIPPDVTSILDAGCGNGIFVNYLISHTSKFSRVHAVDRSNTALKFVKVEKTHASIERLPFRDNEFDLVTCLEVIEHLPKTIYKKSLNELTRVSRKYVIISVPYKQNLEIGQISCPSCCTKFNPDLHLHSFDTVKLKNILNEYGFKCKKIEPICRRERYLIISAFIEWSSKYKANNNAWKFDIVCPVCGANVPGNKSSINNITMKLKTVVKKVWRKTHRELWLLALYEKEE